MQQIVFCWFPAIHMSGNIDNNQLLHASLLSMFQAL
jgi:hypothetical protein